MGGNRERTRDPQRTPNQKPKGSADETSKFEAEDARELYGEVWAWKGVDEEEHSQEVWGDTESGQGSHRNHRLYLSSLEEFAGAPRAHRPKLASLACCSQGRPVSSSFSHTDNRCSCNLASLRGWLPMRSFP